MAHITPYTPCITPISPCAPACTLKRKTGAALGVVFQEQPTGRSSRSFLLQGGYHFYGFLLLWLLILLQLLVLLVLCQDLEFEEVCACSCWLVQIMSNKSH